MRSCALATASSPLACDVRLSSFVFFSSRRRHTRLVNDWSSDVCSSDLFLAFDHSVSYRDEYRLAAVETGRLHENRLVGEQPAHRKQLEAALREPLLLPDANPIVRRNAIERGKRHDQIRRGEETGGKPLPTRP